MTQTFFQRHEDLFGGALLFTIVFIIPIFGGKTIDVYFGFPHIIFATGWYIGLIILIVLCSDDRY